MALVRVWWRWGQCGGWVSLAQPCPGGGTGESDSAALALLLQPPPQKILENAEYRCIGWQSTGLAEMLPQRHPAQLLEDGWSKPHGMREQTELGGTVTSLFKATAWEVRRGYRNQAQDMAGSTQGTQRAGVQSCGC